jgi:hypothetical protein
MAYSPSKYDLPQESSIGYTPSINDLPSDEHPLVTKIKNVAGGALESAAQPGATLNRMLVGGFNNLTGSNLPTMQSTQVLSPQNDSSTSALVGKIAGGVLPFAETGGATALLGDYGLHRALAIPATGAAVGAASSPENPTMGGILGAAGAGAGAMIPGLTRLAANSTNAIRGRLLASVLPDHLATLVDHSNQLNNSDAYSLAKNNFENQKSAESNLWDQSIENAKQLDNNGVKFNTESYVRNLQNALKDKLPRYANQDDRDLFSSIINGQIDKAQSSSIDPLTMMPKQGLSKISDALQERKVLNNGYSSNLSASGLPKSPVEKDAYSSAINALKSAINDTVQSNSSDPAVQDFKQIYDQANSKTQENSNIFQRTVPASQKGTKSTIFSNAYNNPHFSSDTSSFVNDFLPNSKLEGTGKFEQLGGMLGDQQKANDLIKSNYFGNSYKPNGDVDTTSLLKKYNSLSSQQKDYLLSPQEKSMFDTLKNAYDSDAGEGALKQIAQHIPGYYLIKAGKNFISQKFGNALLQKQLAQPGGIVNASKYTGMQSGFPNPIGRALSNVKAPSFLSDALSKLGGSQNGS